MLFSDFIPKRHLSNPLTKYPGVFGGGAETEIFTIDYSSSSKFFNEYRQLIHFIDKYLVCGRMNSGNFNTVANTSAFIAILDLNLRVTESKIFSFNNVTGEQTYAAAWSMQSPSGYILGVIGTDNHHNLFYTNAIATSKLDTLNFYPNAITGTTLLSFQTPDTNSFHFAYFVKTSTAGDREILVNWRNSESDDSALLLLHKTGYDVFHTRRQITRRYTLWSGYVYTNSTDSSKIFLHFSIFPFDNCAFHIFNVTKTNI